MDIQQKRITIIGAQRSGTALARLVKGQGGIPRISEAKAEDQLPNDFKLWVKQQRIEIEYGGHTQAFIKNSDLVVLSPGVRIDSAPAKWAKENHILVLGEIEFAFQFCEKPVIALTGSNGKTTTVTLIHQVITQSGKKACLCGNVGLPFSNFAAESEDYDYFIVEVSSFQLESMVGSKTGFVNSLGWPVKKFQPYISVILNFSQNHLDRHADLNEYFTAKKNVFLNQTSVDYAVVNFQDQYTSRFIDGIRSTVKYFNNPNDKVDFHQNPNYAAVIKVAGILGISRSVCEKVFENFKGVEHRLEKVADINGVLFVNDSKSTTAEATRWALSRFNEPIVLICGGRDKNIDYTVLKGLVKEKVKAIVAIGEAKLKIQNAFQDVVPVHLSQTMQQAIEEAYHLAKAKEVVVLSPMCASFDMFCDYEHRGRNFKELVHQVKEEINKSEVKLKT